MFTSPPPEQRMPVARSTGVKNILSKSLGSNTPINVVRATIDGLKKLRTSEEVEKLRQPERA